MCSNAFTSFLLLHAALRVAPDLKWPKILDSPCLHSNSCKQAVFGQEGCDKATNAVSLNTWKGNSTAFQCLVLLSCFSDAGFQIERAETTLYVGSIF